MNTLDVSSKVGVQFKYYVFLSVFYAILMVTAQAVAYRLIQIGPFTLPGGIFIFPATFAVSDVIAEVYGPTLARKSIYAALFAQAFYTFMPMLINGLPYPMKWHDSHAYQIVFDFSWLVFLSNFVAVMMGMILNTQIIGKTKLRARGKWFLGRSLLSSAVGEFVLTAIIVSIALVPIEGMGSGVHLFLNMFLFKIGFSVLAVFPAGAMVVLFKRLDQVDVYEANVTFNPLHQFFKQPEKPSNLIDFVKNKKQKEAEGS